MDNKFTTRLSHANGIAILTVSGQIDIYVKAEFESSVAALLESKAPSIIDLSLVDYFDSTGLTVLVKAKNLVDERGGTLHLVITGKTILRVLAITNLDRRFSIHETLAGALRAAVE